MGDKYINFSTGEEVTPDTDNRLTPAQRNKVKFSMSDSLGATVRPIKRIIHCQGPCMGLEEGWVVVDFKDGFRLGIDPDGRGHS